MQKILIAAYNLEIGGIEKSLINFINEMKNDFDITLLLEEKKGTLLYKVPLDVKIIEYTPENDSNLIKRKVKNLIKRIKFFIKYKNKFDCAISFATYSKVSSYVARTASKNSILWGHADYLSLYNNEKNEVIKFFKELNFNKFKKIVFVSQEGKNSFLNIFPKTKLKITACNNFIDDKEIIEKAKEEISLKKENVFTFLNVGRHDERQKRLTRLIEAANKLKMEKYNFKILFVGDGQNTSDYKRTVQENNLTDVITFIGKKENPYPYFHISDCVILTSEYEGYPVVFLESFLLKKPIITTKVSDYQGIQDKYGYVTEKNTESIYEAMKKIIENGFEIKERFDPDEYNEKIKNKIIKIIKEDGND